MSRRALVTSLVTPALLAVGLALDGGERPRSAVAAALGRLRVAHSALARSRATQQQRRSDQTGSRHNVRLAGLAGGAAPSAQNGGPTSVPGGRARRQHQYHERAAGAVSVPLPRWRARPRNADRRDWCERSPASASTNTTKEDPRNAEVRRPEFGIWAATDIPLMKAMHVNVVRMYIDPGVPGGPKSDSPRSNGPRSARPGRHLGHHDGRQCRQRPRSRAAGCVAVQGSPGPPGLEPRERVERQRAVPVLRQVCDSPGGCPGDANRRCPHQVDRPQPCGHDQLWRDRHPRLPASASATPATTSTLCARTWAPGWSTSTGGRRLVRCSTSGGRSPRNRC